MPDPASIPLMKPSLTERLCTRCALCCDGSLFADVELAGRAEAAGLEAMGLVVDGDDADGEVLSLPCRALRGKRCGIYAHRPNCCRTFECGLLQDVRRGAVAEERAQEYISEALNRIRRVRELMRRLGQRVQRLPLKEQCAEALALPGGDPEVNRTRAELEVAMSAVESLIRKVFLRQAKRGTRRQGPDPT